MSKSIPITAAALFAVLATGCVANNPAPAASGSTKATSAIAVTITDDGCQVSTSSAGSGPVSFQLSNNGTVKNEFEVLADDQLRIVGERENLGPGTVTDYSLTLTPGTYYTACKKNMVGNLVGTTQFTVTDSGVAATPDANTQAARDKAIADYEAYVRDQVGQLVAATTSFTDAVRAGDTVKAKELYPTAREHYERIEPTAEAFGITEPGDLDLALDEREADYQEASTNGEVTAGRQWSGWHALEKYLWTSTANTTTAAQASQLATKLDTDTKKLYDLVYSKNFSLTLSDISNGAISLLEEVATTKITGEEEAFSHTDLYDFKANVEGAQVAYGNVKALAQQADPDLVTEIDAQFKAMDAELAKYAKGDGYVSYDTVDEAGRKDLSNRVNALRVPLAKLTGAILQ